MKPFFPLAIAVLIVSSHAGAQTAGFPSDGPEGTFNLSSGPTSVATLGSIPSPAMPACD